MLYKNTDFLAGLFVLVAFTVMLWATVILGGHQGAIREFFAGKENKNLTIQFDNISGLEVNHAVKVQGHKFGKVVKIDLSENGELLVDVELQKRVNIYEDYSIDIKEESVLGGKAIYIDVGNKNKKPIEFLYTAKAPKLKGKAAGNLMAEGGNVLAENREDFREIIKNIKEISEKIKTIANKVNEGDGLLGRILNDKQLSDDIKTSVTNINTILSKTSKGEGLFGKLINDDGLYKDTQNIAKTAQPALKYFREQAPTTIFVCTILIAF